MKKSGFLLLFAFLPLFFFAILTGSALLSAKAEDEVARSFSIAHLTDPHVFDPACANPYSKDFQTAENSLNLYSRSLDSFLAALDKIREQAPDYLIVSGDMTADGGRSSHELVANALRAAQDEMRLTNPNFQIFVIPGNHDLYNAGARNYLPSEEELAPLSEEEKTALVRSYGSRMALPINLVDFYEIYRGLGYGAGTIGDVRYFFKSEYFYGCGNEDPLRALSPNDPTESEIAAQKSDPTAFDKASRAGGLSYIARMPNGFTLVAIDSVRLSYVSSLTYRPIGDEAYRFGRWACNAAGDVNREQLRWIGSVLSSSGAPAALVGTMHHALVPHWEMEDTITSNCVANDYRTARYFLADLGVRYFFTGHTHANDVQTYISQKGNVLYDISSPSTACYGAAVRVARLDVLKSGAEKLFDNLYAIEAIADLPDLNAHLDERLSAIRNLIPDRYLNEDLVVRLKDGASALSGKTVANAFTIGSVTSDLLKDLIDDAFSLDLVRPKFSNGKYAFSNEPTAGYRFLDLAKDLIEYLFDMDASLGRVPGGYTVASLAQDLYKRRLAGAEFLEPTPELLAVAEAFESGELPKKLASVLLDFLTPQLVILFDAPIGLTEKVPEGKGFNLSSYEARYEKVGANDLGKLAFNLLKNNEVTSLRTFAIALKKLSQNAIVQTLIASADADLAQTVLSYAAKITANTKIETFLKENILDEYLTPSFFADLGDYAKSILLSFATDASPDGVSIEKDGNVSRYAYPTNALLTLRLASGERAYGGTYSYNGALSKEENPPTQADGRLPEMVSLSYGADPAAQVNVKWFTRVQGELDAFEASESYVRYYGETSAGAFFLANSEKVKLTLPRISLGALSFKTVKVEYEMHFASLPIGSFKDGERVFFEVGNDSFGWSEVYSFRKSGNETIATILAAGGVQGGVEKDYEKGGETIAQALSLFPNAALFLSAGDAVAEGDNLLQWTWLLRHNAALFTGYITLTAAGSEGSGLTRYLAAPNGASGGEAAGYYYSVDLENAHVAVLNTNDRSPSGALSPAQTEWLTADLDGANGKWKIVVMNEGPYSVGTQSSSESVRALRASLTELFAAHGVSLVLQGGAHAYSLSKYLGADGDPVTVTYDQAGNAVAPNGVLYLDLGTLGANNGNYSYTADVPLKDRSNQGDLLASFGAFMTRDMRLELTGAPSFAALRISESKLSILTYAIDGEKCGLLDNLSIVRSAEKLPAPDFSFAVEHDLKIETLSSSSLKNARVLSFSVTDGGDVRYLKGYSVGENVKSKCVFIGGKAYLASSCFIATAEASEPAGEYAPLPRAELITLVPYQGRAPLRIRDLILIIGVSLAALLAGGAVALFLLKRKRKSRKQPPAAISKTEPNDASAESQSKGESEPDFVRTPDEEAPLTSEETPSSEEESANADGETPLAAEETSTVEESEANESEQRAPADEANPPRPSKRKKAKARNARSR